METILAGEGSGPQNWGNDKDKLPEEACPVLVWGDERTESSGAKVKCYYSGIPKL